MSATRGLIVLRTHFFDDRVEQIARRYSTSTDYDVTIAVDETDGPVDCRGFDKLSLTPETCRRLGLIVDAPKPIWRCGDYLFYHLRARAHAYRFIWSIEYDVHVHFDDPLDFFRDLDARATDDLLWADFAIDDKTWWWRKHALLHFNEVVSGIFALVRLTPQAIDLLYEKRAHDARRVRRLGLNAEDHWCNDEGFVGSWLHELGRKIADFNDYGAFYTPQTFAQKLILHVSDLPATDGRLYHALRWGRGYLAGRRSYYKPDLLAVLRESDDMPDEDLTEALTDLIVQRLATTPDDPARAFGPEGPLKPCLSYLNRPVVAEALLRGLARKRLRVCLETAQNGGLCEVLARTPSMDNVAMGRAAWSSSVAARMKPDRTTRKDPRLAAEAGADGDSSVEIGFESKREEGPWWACDFAAVHALRRVRVFNRKFAADELSGVVVETSLDFVNWQEAFAHDPRDTERLAGPPLDIRVSPPTPARYLRVRLPRRGVLHFSEIEAYRA